MTIALFEKMMTSKTIEVDDMPPLVVAEPSLLDRATVAIEEVVREAGPDFRYQGHPHALSGISATYVHRGRPDCIVGRVLHKMGVPVSVLAANENMIAYHLVGHLFGGSPDQYRVARALREAQHVNDSGVPWGIALDAYYSSLHSNR